MARKIIQSNERILNKVKNKSLNTDSSIDLTPFKPHTIISPKANIIIGLFIFLFTLIIYQMTNAKSTSFWDAGEYISSSSILGIPHPPGNPFYILLGRVFSIFNFGFDHAVMISFMVSLMGALGVVFTYLFTVQLISMWKEEKFLVFTGGFIAAMLTAFSFTYWMNSVEAAVYAGMALIINMAIWLTLIWVKQQENFSHQNILLLIIYLLFLGFSIHQTAFQIAPAILFIAVYPYIQKHFKDITFWGKTVLYIIGLFVIYIIFDSFKEVANFPELPKLAFGVALIGIVVWCLKDNISRRAWLLGLLMVVLGFSTHLFLLVRSGHRPFINEGHPHNLTMFMDYILRRQYLSYNFLDRRGDFFTQVYYHFFRYFSWQYMDISVVTNWLKIPSNIILACINLLVTFLGLKGFFYSFRNNKHSFAYLTSLFFMVSVAMIFVMNLSFEEARDRDYFFLMAFNIWAVAMGIGAVGFINYFSNNKIVKYVLSGLLLLFPMVNMISQYNRHDRTGEFIALGYGINLLNGLEENAILFTNGDNDTFPVWYAQAVADKNAIEHIYPAENVFPTAHTNSLIKRGLEWKATHIRGIRQDVVVANLSLLNTPWYLKQLRDMDSIEFNLTDTEIDRLRSMILPSDITVNISSPNGESFSITYPRGTPMKVQDFAVLKIIQDNFGKRPIYFAVTVAEYSGFEEYLVYEGFVSRVVSTRDFGRNNYERLKNNLNNVYFYGGIFEEGLYRDDNKLRLIMNYGASFLRLSDEYNVRGDYETALMYFERGMEFVQFPEDKIRFYGRLALSNAEAGNIERAEELLEYLFENSNDLSNTYITAAVAMIRGGEHERAFYYIDLGLEDNPFDRDLIALTFELGYRYDMRAEASRIISKLVPFQRHLNDYLDVLNDPASTIDDLFNLER